MSATVREGRIVPALLREAYPRHTVKMTARAADVPHETGRNWVRGRAEPSLSTLLRMASRCERMATALERILNDRRNAAVADRPVSLAGKPAATDGGDAQ